MSEIIAKTLKSSNHRQISHAVMDFEKNLLPVAIDRADLS